MGPNVFHSVLKAISTFWAQIFIHKALNSKLNTKRKHNYFLFHQSAAYTPAQFAFHQRAVGFSFSKEKKKITVAD